MYVSPQMVVVFDLDDTLYLERDYVRSGMLAVDAWFRRETGISGFGETCLSLFEAGIRGRIFDDALATLHNLPSRDWCRELVGIYRSHTPDIRLAPDAKRFLESTGDGLATAIITDGFLHSQQNKVRALGVERAVGRVIYTDLWGRDYWKPHPRAFEEVERSWPVPAERLVYIADNPTKDFLTPRRRGWRTVQIEREGRIHQVYDVPSTHLADARVSTLDELAGSVLLSPDRLLA